MSDTLDQFAQAKLDGLEAKGLLRRLTVTERTGPIEILRGGRKLISFSCNDYLNLSQHPSVKQAAKDAIDRLGVGSGASRLVTGDHPLLPELESRLARLKGTEACAVMGSGFLTNTGVIPTLVTEGDLVLADEWSHACIIVGGRLSKADQHLFRHNDLHHLRALLDRHRASHGHCLIVTDGVFSMDGDLAPVHELAALAKEYDAWLMTDDAHGIGQRGVDGVKQDGRGDLRSVGPGRGRQGVLAAGRDFAQHRANGIGQAREQRHHLAAVHGQVYTVQDVRFAIPGVEIGNAQQLSHAPPRHCPYRLP